jgi:hypothetical protein
VSNGDTTDAIGASRDLKNPPFCKIAFFFLRETDFFVRRKNRDLLALYPDYTSNGSDMCYLRTGVSVTLHYTNQISVLVWYKDIITIS